MQYIPGIMDTIQVSLYIVVVRQQSVSPISFKITSLVSQYPTTAKVSVKPPEEYV